MTEAKWLASTDPDEMLRFLRFEVTEGLLGLHSRTRVRRGAVSERKLLLFACACCRRVGGLCPRSVKDELATAERHADRLSSEVSWESLAEDDLLIQTFVDPLDEADDIFEYRPFEVNAVFAVRQLFGGLSGLVDCMRWSAQARVEFAEARRAEERESPGTEEAYEAMLEGERLAVEADQVGLLREIFGNPFRAAEVPEAWRAANGGAVVALAQSIYNEGKFDLLPILADALEDAGCTDADLLAHCRQPGEHVRGCWVIDLLLGKG
jgi:hypothetical protein